MLTHAGCLSRRRALRERLGDFDLLIISQPQHIFYLSGFLTRPTELASWGLHFLIIDRDGQTRLVTDRGNRRAADDAFVDQVDDWVWYESIRSAEEKFSAGVKALSDTLSKHYPAARRVAAESAHLPAMAREALGSAQVSDLTEALVNMRLVKHEDELACIRRALRAAEAGHAAARQAVRPGLTELEIYAEIHRAIAVAAGEPVLMMGDFAAGGRSGDGGGPPTGNVLREGDLMILDVFPVIGGYRADITNTLCVGQPSQEQIDRVEALKAAMRGGEAVMRPGVTGAEVYEAVRAPIVKAGLGDYFRHHAGHGLGLGHPEPPYLVPKSEEVLQAGNVITLEPGAYRPGWGGARVEHDYLITAAGFERLSNHQIGL